MKSSSCIDGELKPGESLDAIMDGRLRLIQSKGGYRFSIDAVHLSQFVFTRPGDLVVDLGTGCGIIPLILLLTRPIGYAIGLEIQPDLAHQAKRNALINQYEGKMEIIQGDIRHPPLKPSSADVVICNPPYRQQKSGRINPHPQRAIARHEIMASLHDILDTARMLLKPRGRFAMIYPASRLVETLRSMVMLGLEPKRLRVIYHTLSSEAKLVLLEVSKGEKAGLKILPPVINQGQFSISM